MHVHEFQSKWLSVVAQPGGGIERSKAQEHFVDLCRMLGQQTPAEHDPTGNLYAFEKLHEFTLVDLDRPEFFRVLLALNLERARA